MLELNRKALITALGLLAACLVAGCAGQRTAGQVTQGQPATEGNAAPLAAPTFSQLLPPPGGLVVQFPEGDDKRAVSYIETDLILRGREYSVPLPKNNVGISNDAAKFSTAWTGPTVGSIDDLGYCMYLFTVAGYDRAPQVRYGWDDPPSEISDAWLGLANWDADRWEWYPCNSAGLLNADSFDGYLSDTDRVLVVVVLANAEVSSLRYVHLGPPQVVATINAPQAGGLAPYAGTYSAYESTTSLGTIDRYEWDWDNDGVFEEDTGTTNNAAHTYTSVGEHIARVRVRNSFGEQATASVGVAVIGPWVHSWGNVAGEGLIDIAYHTDGSIFAVGSTWFDYVSNLLLIKYDLEGNLAWAKSWGGAGNEYGYSVALGDDGEVYLLGETYSFGAGSGDIILQRWDTAGNLVWTSTWGGSDTEEAKTVAFRSDAVWVLGKTRSFGDTLGDGLLIKYDTSGNVLWAKTFGGASTDSPYDLQTHWDVLSQILTIHITGSTSSYVPSGFGAMYARFNDSGDLLALNVLQGPLYSSGHCIAVSGLGGSEVYIGGGGGPSSNSVMLVELSNAPGALRKLWDGGDLDFVNDLLRSGDSLILCGATDSFSARLDGLLLNFSLDGALQATEIWKNNDEQNSFRSISWFPGGILLASSSSAGISGGWMPASGDLSDVSGTWSTEANSTTLVTGTTGSPSVAPVDIHDGVIDTGGGSTDTLALVRLVP